MPEYLSVTEYAQMSSKDPGNIRRMLASGRLKGSKIGNQWVIQADSKYPDDMRQRSGEYRNWRRRTVFNSNKAIAGEVRLLIADLKQMFINSLKKVILYGSYARGQQTKESDIDIAIILSKPMSADEKKRFYSCVAAHELNCGVTLSVVDIDNSSYERWAGILPFYKNIAKDGIILWKAQ